MRSKRKAIILSVVAVVVLSILRVEMEVRLGVDLFYVWLGAICVIIGFAFSRLWAKSNE